MSTPQAVYWISTIMIWPAFIWTLRAGWRHLRILRRARRTVLTVMDQDGMITSATLDHLLTERLPPSGMTHTVWHSPVSVILMYPAVDFDQEHERA